MLREVNAQPDRLDLDDVLAHAALEHGAMLAISTDAHVAELGFMGWGVDQTRQGWVTPDRVANTRPRAPLTTTVGRHAPFMVFPVPTE